MSDDEQMDYSWSDLMEKAERQGLDKGATKIPKDIIAKVMDNDDPWSKERIMAVIDKVDSEKNGITKDEYVAWNKYERATKTPKADNKLTMCVPKFAKWASDQAKTAAFEACGKLMTDPTCIDSCEWMKPEFSSYDDWKHLLVKAGLKEDVSEMPLDVYLKAAKDLWPHLESKMGKWMEEAEQRDPTKVDRGEFQQFREYIHKVGDSGCVVDYKTFISYNSKTEGTPTNYKDQFNKNSGCKAHTSETQCASPCVWQGEKPAETEFDCAKATAVASCPTDKCMWDPTKAVKCDKKHTTNPTQPLPSCPSFEGPKLNECPLDRCVK
jgi:hypothetical protein